MKRIKFNNLKMFSVFIAENKELRKVAPLVGITPDGKRHVFYSEELVVPVSHPPHHCELSLVKGNPVVLILETNEEMSTKSAKELFTTATQVVIL